MKKKKILIGVSGGPDSMALLYTLRKRDPIVAHVNYKVRKTSDRDEKIVRNFCRSNNIELHVKKAPLFNPKKNDNFQKWAREIRYDFFKEIYFKNECKALYLAHHEDDHIETYLIQKKRNIRCEHYGLKAKNKIKGMEVKRVLLSLSKKEIIDFCNKKKISYGLDETNKNKKYLRNKIRHEIVFNLSDKKRKKILRKIRKENRVKKKEKKLLEKNKEKAIENNKINLNKFKNLKEKEKRLLLSYYINKNFNVFNISKGNLIEIIKKTKSKKPNIILFTNKKQQMIKSYNNIGVFFKKENYEYEIKKSDTFIEEKEFKYKKETNKNTNFFVSKELFPLKVIKNNFKYKKVNRLFIKKKVPLNKRENWPILVDKNKNLLLVIGLKLFYNDEKIKEENKIYFNIEKRF